MEKQVSRRVLIIGCDVFALEDFEYIRARGAYMISADKCPKEKNAYRKFVDEAVELDTDNTDEIIEYCRKNKIDAVFTNFMEESFERARIINEAIGNTFCHTKEQWQTFVRKDNFRRLCIESGIDVPKTYFSGKISEITKEVKENISVPAIVKPVDNAGGIGISVLYDKRELDEAIKYADENSPSSSIIIEEYIEGRETVFTYVVQNGIYKLTATSDKYVYKNEKNLTTIPELYIFPSDRHGHYVQNVNEKVIAMLKGQGLNNCTIFFQTIEKDGTFYFFESGLRFEGTANYLITEHYTGQSALRFFYDYVLKTETDYDITKEDPQLNGHTAAMFVIHLKKGTVRHVKGQEKIRDNKNIFYSAYVKRPGDTVGENQMDQCFAAFYMDASDRKELVKRIRFIKRTLKVRDRFYRNMIINSFDEKMLIKNK